MKKNFVRIFAFMLCVLTLLLCVAPAFAADSICKKNCATYDKKISRSYTVASSWPFYAKDSVTIYLGANGAIIGYDVLQSKRDCRPMIKLEDKGIKVTYATSDYLLITSSWSLGLGWDKVSMDLTTQTYHYMLTSDGTLKKI